MIFEWFFKTNPKLDTLAQGIADNCIDRQVHEYSLISVATKWRVGGEELKQYLSPYFRLLQKTGGNRDMELMYLKKLSTIGWSRYLAAKNCTL